MKTKNKNTKKIITNFKCILKNVKFKGVNLNLAKQITILGVIIGFISLYLPWIKDIGNNIEWNSFNSITGNIGFLLSIILLLPIFIIFSTNYKDKIKLYSDLSIKNHFIIITSGFFVINFSIISLSFINGLNTFFENIFYGKGVILSMTSGFIILIGGLLLRKEYYLNNSEIILNKLSNSRENNKEDDNMKLPF